MELSQPRGLLDQWSDLFWRKKAPAGAAVVIFLLIVSYAISDLAAECELQTAE